MRIKRLSRNSEKENIEGIDQVFDSEENLNQVPDTSDMLTLEGLRRTYNSCSKCGVSWYDDHVSLDCTECGGYSMTRPCPTCNGECGNKWRRDVKSSRVKKQAQWHGTCNLSSSWKATSLESSLPEDNKTNCLTENLVHQTHLTSTQ
ncbi:protein pinocchio [Parasteatoda tepidariorum]|uniref:protein pinocchio n=1 Tax=Parasteatoda tepidariorum TaxID=114398 RepID=UPI00077FA4BF|nr:protein pinocchio [Parasteatoda tepidariorum]XP_015918410.1 protein pinocchio [Parasteatoda tepidariorum]XP_015918411.1 protein pinocchio [Parasteatoda tepidariorum]